MKADRAGEPTRPPGALEMDEMRRSPEVYGFITDVTELADDGWYGNPQWASLERAKDFTDVVASRSAGRHRRGDERAPHPRGQRSPHQRGERP